MLRYLLAYLLTYSFVYFLALLFSWRIHPEDATRIPPEECPETWGRRDEWLECVREERRKILEERRRRRRGGGGEGGGGGGGANGALHDDMFVNEGVGRRNENSGILQSWLMTSALIVGIMIAYNYFFVSS